MAPEPNLLVMIELGRQRIGMLFTANTAYYKALARKYPITVKTFGSED